MSSFYIDEDDRYELSVDSDDKVCDVQKFILNMGSEMVECKIWMN